MGIDYVPFKLKKEVAEDELQPFVEAQSLHYKSMPTRWMKNYNDEKSSCDMGRHLEELHLGPCKAASAEIKARIIFPEEASYRVYAVINNLTLPQNVRHQSITTILPSELPQFVDTWVAAQMLACWKKDPKNLSSGLHYGDIQWMSKFLTWVEKYRDMGYGLYWCW